MKNLFSTVFENYGLTKNLAKRDISNRYRGSFAGGVWVFLNPILMLTVYTFVFSVVFKARWSSKDESRLEFALILFSGLMIFNVFSECLNRAPGLINGNVNYVKKIVFPLEILPIVNLIGAIFNFVVGFIVWLIFHFIFFGTPTIKILFMPIILVPLIFFTLGVTWFISSLSVYIRDINQFVGIFTTALLFLSPIFFPVSNLPDIYQDFMNINPLTYIIEQTRNTIIWGQDIDFLKWIKSSFISFVVACLGFFSFKKLKKGFSDVI